MAIARKALKVEIKIEIHGPAPRAFLRRYLRVWAQSPACLNLLSKRQLAQLQHNPLLRLAFVSSHEIQSMNRQYRGKDKPTDVLSFNLGEPGVLGDLALCLPVIRRQAREFGISENEEALFMVLHGILHLLGLDHEQGPRQARKMFAIQKKFFQCLKPNSKGLKNGAFDRVI